MPTTLSPQNPRIALAHDLRTPAARRDQGRFVIEGLTMLEEARRSAVRPLELYINDEHRAAVPAERFAAYEQDGTEVFIVPARAMARISDLDAPPAVAAVVPLPRWTAAEILARPGPVLLLAGVNDPGNAGTLVRSAEAFGAAGVLFGRGGADPFGPKVVRATMGSIFRLPVALVDAEELPAAAAAAGRPVIATDVDGEDLGAAPLPANAILAVGNERRGVRDWLPRWDRAVRIPQRATAESLNAAVAGSIVLYVASRVK
ncbi:RNA methyltransferase [Vulcanimicrobium alpinum]|uniref:TrmH family RNA methyltransferase n=1 Tax=Vulcanimicrobium alpinum TaxID=3016050 RepID=UPI00295E790B|nr:RNA methyltransferase [Vulcanimicrobium alpinum]